MQGTIFNIQRFSTQDGPGVRTTVFLQGCSLDCRWCHNPEGIPARPGLMFVDGRCIVCGECRTACPRHGPFPPGDPMCTACGACAEQCPTGARVICGRPIKSEDLLRELRKDVLLFDQSGGGVTFSGGEPLSQPDFLRELLEGCRRTGISSALDTCGFAPQDILLELSLLSDLVLYDLKGVDEERHRANTGVPVLPILENLKALAAVHPNVWLRIPVVPGFNDDLAELEAMARFARSLGTVREIYLLPYHSLGAGKRQRLGQETRETPFKVTSKDALENAAAPFRDCGFDPHIGGAS